MVDFKTILRGMWFYRQVIIFVMAPLLILPLPIIVDGDVSRYIQIDILEISEALLLLNALNSMYCHIH